MAVTDYLREHHHMQNRQKDEIARDIMSVSNGGVYITKIMFHAYMTHGQVKLYLNQLIEKGLVEHDKLERKFYTTPKGMEYLATFESMRQLLPLVTRRASPSDRLASAFL